MSSTRTFALAGVVVAGLVAIAVLVVPSASAKKPPPDFYGVVPQEEPEPRDFEQMERDRVGMVRQLFHWSAIEPFQGQYDWSTTDEVMRQASARGIEVFPVLYGVPVWAQPEDRVASCGPACAPTTPQEREGFARFAAAGVARYGPGGTFWEEPAPPPEPCPLPPLPCRRGAETETPIQAWQVWNEQNSPKYYAPQVNVDQYAALLEETASAIRAQDPGAEVVVGGMWGPPGAGAVVPALRYLERLYRVDASRESFDSVAVHPYAGRFENVKSQIRATRRFVTSVGDGDVGIWVTELGWASGGRKREPLVKTRAEQAALLRKSFRFLIRKRNAWRIRGVHWYSLRDTRLGFGICAWCPRSGLRTADGAEKPAAAAFRNLPRSG